MAESTKLIEVSIPLEAINRESAREKSIRHGHPSTLHIWWARRPLAAARAVLFAQLVDDPSSRPDEFPTEELQKKERERLHKLIERLVLWENVNNQDLLAEARAEIRKSAGGELPALLDPFAGGGTIPLEAQRLGLEAFAADLNPVAVLINKALIEIPPKFAGRPPVSPSVNETELNHPWPGATGLAEDVRRYGKWMCDEAERLIGSNYPKATLPDGTQAAVIAWIWARNVICPNPACGIRMPLVRSWWLGKKKGKEAFVSPSVVGGEVRFAIHQGLSGAPQSDADGTINRAGATCIGCGASVEFNHIRAESRAGRMGRQLMAVVSEQNRRRLYLPATREHELAAEMQLPSDPPEGELFDWPGRINVVRYGITQFKELFTPRQLNALITFSDLIGAVRLKVLEAAQGSGMGEGLRLEDGGTEASAYADAVAIYLALALSKLADISNANVTWKPSMDQAIHLFTRQAIPMVWDFAETPPFGKAAGSYEVTLTNVAKAINYVGGPEGHAFQSDARHSVEKCAAVISTDPPYYDNIGYSDLSDFFYIWLRRSLKEILPDLFATLLVPKADELVANQYRHNGAGNAKQFFESGFKEVFKLARESAVPSYPMTVYYAFKQSDSDEDGQASTGWETLLDGMVHNAWCITSTWPLRSELSNRMIAAGTNALASSIVLSLRPRPASAPTQDRRGFIDAMKAELGPSLQKLQAGGIAPVDLPQAAIGPGMAVFSRYSAVLEPDGSQMTVRSALARINEVLDEVLSEQEGDFDPTTRFAIAWFRTHGYGEGKFGNADDLARARNTAVSTLERSGILSARASIVKLFRPSDLSDDYNVVADESVSAWEVLHHLIRVLETEGAPAAGEFLAKALSRSDGAVDAELLPELAHLLFRVSEDNKWTKDAIRFNSLVTVWPDIVDSSRGSRPKAQQGALDFDSGNDD